MIVVFFVFIIGTFLINSVFVFAIPLAILFVVFYLTTEAYYFLKKNRQTQSPIRGILARWLFFISILILVTVWAFSPGCDSSNCETILIFALIPFLFIAAGSIVIVLESYIHHRISSNKLIKGPKKKKILIYFYVSIALIVIYWIIYESVSPY